MRANCLAQRLARGRGWPQRGLQFLQPGEMLLVQAAFAQAVNEFQGAKGVEPLVEVAPELRLARTLARAVRKRGAPAHGRQHLFARRGQC